MLIFSSSTFETDFRPKWMPFCACGLVTGAYAFLLLALATQAESLYSPSSQKSIEQVEGLLTNTEIIVAGLEAYGQMWAGIEVMAAEVRAALEAAKSLPGEIRRQMAEAQSLANVQNADVPAGYIQGPPGSEYPAQLLNSQEQQIAPLPSMIGLNGVPVLPPTNYIQSGMPMVNNQNGFAQQVMPAVNGNAFNQNQQYAPPYQPQPQVQVQPPPHTQPQPQIQPPLPPFHNGQFVNGQGFNPIISEGGATVSPSSRDVYNGSQPPPHNIWQ